MAATISTMITVTTNNKYVCGELLGTGSFSNVYACYCNDATTRNTDDTTNNLCIKIITRKTHRLPMEISILKSVSHKNIVKFIETNYRDGNDTNCNDRTNDNNNCNCDDTNGTNDNGTNGTNDNNNDNDNGTNDDTNSTNNGVADDMCYIIFERVTGMLLTKYVNMHKCQCRIQLKSILFQLIDGVGYLHDQFIAHRDLKLCNLMINADNCHVTIIDFGFAVRFEPGKFNADWCGSPRYMSPEIILKSPIVGPEVDCWAIGVIAYILFHGQYPFGKKRHTVYNEPYYSNVIPDQLRNFIAECLQKTPSLRLSSRQMQHHTFFEEIN